MKLARKSMGFGCLCALLWLTGCQPADVARTSSATPEPTDATQPETQTPSSTDAGTSDVDRAAVDSVATEVAASTAATSVTDVLGPSPPVANETSAEAISIVFEDIQLPIQADTVFRPFMLTDRVKELDGKRVRINGYMLPDSKTKGIRQFVLLKNTECKFGPGGQADHLINVLMVDGVTAKYRDDPISVEGVLTINPFQGPDGNTWSLYDLACERVEAYHPRR